MDVYHLTLPFSSLKRGVLTEPLLTDSPSLFAKHAHPGTQRSAANVNSTSMLTETDSRPNKEFIITSSEAASAGRNMTDESNSLATV